MEGDAGHLVQPAEVFAGLHGGQVGVGLGEVGPGLLTVVPGVPPGQGAVPDDADAAERAVQYAHLFGVRVGPALVRRPPGAPATRGTSPATAASPPSTPGPASGTATAACSWPRRARRLAKKLPNATCWCRIACWNSPGPGRT